MDRIRQLLRETMGLEPESIGALNLDRLIRGQMKASGYENAEQYARQLAVSPGCRARLVEAVVINETWFFRDAAAFAPIVELALKRSDPLRILSLPCSTGEEPYSLAITLLNHGVEHFEIDARDISEQALGRARRGEYGANSFRGEDKELWKASHFLPLGERWQLRPDVLRRVSFRTVNVAQPKFLEPDAPFDVIVFRHLSIYLDGLVRQAAFAQLHQHLKPGGLLCVAASEAGQVPGHLFRRVSSSGLFEAVAASAPFVRKLPVPRKTYRPPPAPAPPPPSAPVESLVDMLERARSHSDRGEVVEAAELCRQMLARGGSQPEVHYLLAMLASASGDWEEQGKQLRKVIYLDPEHSDALFHLALLSEPAQAQRLRSRARRIQAGASPP